MDFQYRETFEELLGVRPSGFDLIRAQLQSSRWRLCLECRLDAASRRLSRLPASHEVGYWRRGINAPSGRPRNGVFDPTGQL